MKSRVLGVMLLLLALLTVLMSSLTSIKDRQQADCFRRYNTEFVRVFTERAKASDADRASLSRLITGLNSPDREYRQRVYQKYLEELGETDKRRKANPLPQPPDPTTYCT